jgi:hypothetical protein
MCALGGNGENRNGYEDGVRNYARTTYDVWHDSYDPFSFRCLRG